MNQTDAVSLRNYQATSIDPQLAPKLALPQNPNWPSMVPTANAGGQLTFGIGPGPTVSLEFTKTL